MTTLMLDLAEELRRLTAVYDARLQPVDREYHRDRKGRFASNPGGGFDGALTTHAALDSAPVRLVRPPNGHHGDYTGADITGPEGMGSALALAEMEGVEHETTNSYLRNVGKPPPSRPSGYTPTPEDEQRRKELHAEIEERVAEVDKSMTVSKLPEAVVVYRGVKDGSRMFTQEAWYGKYLGSPDSSFEEQDALWDLWEAGERPDLTGVTWEEKAFGHTTVNGDRLAGYARKIAGLEPVAMKILVPAGTGAVQMSEFDFEAELMLERGLHFRVVADHGTDEGGVRRLDVEVIPRG